MKMKNKSTPFLMILVLSIIATQLSLKSFGVNITPSFGTVMESWGKVAGVIGYAYHPGLVAELDTLSDYFLLTDGQVPKETDQPCAELACNVEMNFDFATPPPIDINDPSVTIEESIQETCLKTTSRIRVKKDTFEFDKLDVEVLQIATESDETSPTEEARPEAKEESIRSIAIGVAGDDAEAESKTPALPFEDKVIFQWVEPQEAPKPEKIKKPCPDVERLKKLDETRRQFDEFEHENELRFLNQTKLPLEIQASMAKKYLEKAKRVRVIIKMNPFAMPPTSKNDSFDVLVGPEESEF